MKQIYSVLTAMAVLFTNVLSAQNVSETFESPAAMSAMLGNCWAFNGVTFTTTSPISGTGSVVTQLNTTSQLTSPELVMPANGSLTISFSYKRVDNNGGAQKLQILLVDPVTGIETKLDEININNNTLVNYSATFDKNITGYKKLILRTTPNISLQYDNLSIGAPYANPGACQAAASPLPVKLVSFQGALNKNKVDLTWLVADNQTAKTFEVQRSANGTDFTTAAVIPASKKTGSENYSFTETVSTPRVLYRLKMYDADAKAEYSKTLAFNSSSTAARSLQVLTNPVKEKLVISFTSESSEIAQVNIYDNAGRVMQRQTLTASQGINTNTIALNGNYRSGLYIVELVTKSGQLSEKIIYSNQ